MSVAAAMQASMRGDQEGVDREIGKELVKAAVMRMMFCPGCGHILDMKKAVLALHDQKSAVVCGECWDKSPEEKRNLIKEVYDGRILHSKRRRK